MKVFLGGTCNESPWRDKLIAMLQMDYFNPVVDDWTEECQAEELRQRASCDFVLYVITPLMTGTYAIAEAVDDSNKRPKKTIFVLLETDSCPDKKRWSKVFPMSRYKSLMSVANMVERNGGTVFYSLEDCAKYLNSKTNGGQMEKSLGNTSPETLRKNVRDVVVFGDDNAWQLLSKASSKNEGWMHSTKAMEIPGVGCIVQATTQHGYNVAEALCFVPGVRIVPTGEKDGVITGRCLVNSTEDLAADNVI